MRNTPININYTDKKNFGMYSNATHFVGGERF